MRGEFTMSETQSPPLPGNEDINARMEAMLAQMADLTSQNIAMRAEIAEKRISDQLGDIARYLKIPESVITHDLPRYQSDFMLKDGKAVSKADETQDAMQVLKALQAQRTHWMPTSQGGCGHEPMRPSRTAVTHAAEVERQSKEWFDNL
jgi:hypothetical protein